MKRMSKHECRPVDGQPKLSRYAQKQKDRLLPVEEIVNERPSWSALTTVPRDRNLKAVIPSFYSRDDFMFLLTADGEELFLSKRTIEKSGFRLQPGYTIHCDVTKDTDKKLRRVIFIHKVERPR